jgi:hypothetical protein
MHTSTPSFSVRRRTVEALKRQSEPHDRPDRRQGRGRAEKSLAALEPIDFVARNEFDFTIKEVAEGRDSAASPACPGASVTAASCTTTSAPILEDMDELPFVSPVYKRDLVIENYFSGYLKHPYLSFYTGRGCKVALHLLPVAAHRRRHRYRVRSVGHCDRRAQMGARRLSAGQGVLLRRRHADRQSAARRGALRARSASSASCGRAMPRRTCRARR